MNLLGGKCIVEKNREMRLEACPRISEHRFAGWHQLWRIPLCGLKLYNLQLIGKDKVDKNSFLHWKKEYIKHHTTDFINRIFIYLPYYCNDNMGDIF